MSALLFAVFLTLAAFVISLVGTRLLILTFRNNRLLLDVPNERSNHSKPVPRGGGLAVIMGMLIPMMVADLELYLVLSILLLASISFIDDLITVPAWLRLLVQTLAVSISLSFMPVDFLPDTPALTEKIIIGIGWIWIINLFNFMDGVDGMSAVEIISIGLSIALVVAFMDAFPNMLSHYAMIAAAAGCGFWWWNKSPARIFLGDVGSIPLGFIMGYLLLYLAMEGYIVAAIIIPAYYVCDASITLLKRLYRGKKLWHAHSEHYYQKAARKGVSHHAITRYVIGVNILLGFLAVQSQINIEIWPMFVAIAYTMVFMLLGFFAHESSNQPTTKS